MKKLLVFICLALCMALFVCSCGNGNDTDTNTDTSTDTQASTNTDTNTDTNNDSQTPDDSDINLEDGKYRVFVCDEDGKGIEGIYVQFCTDEICDFKPTDKNGFLEIPSSEHHIASLTDENGFYHDVVYDEDEYLSFEGDSKLITIVLVRKAK